MSIFNVNYANLVIELLPVDKRNSRLVKLLQVLVSQIQYLRDIVFGSYQNGSTDPVWATGAYNLGQRVIYKHSVYESLVNGNTDTPPTANWFLVQQSSIGIVEQSLYTTQKISLEYALNRWFGTNFQQPPVQSDIYLTVNNQLLPVFRVGATEAISSIVFTDRSSEYVVNAYNNQLVPNLNINVPIAVYNALDTNPANRAAIIQSIANQYLASGITTTVITY